MCENGGTLTFRNALPNDPEDFANLTIARDAINDHRPEMTIYTPNLAIVQRKRPLMIGCATGVESPWRKCAVHHRRLDKPPLWPLAR
jgi:hypothetical protein